MKRTAWTLLTGLAFILISCADEFEFEERVQIRIRNVGQFDYHNVIVSAGSTVNFGFILSNRTSEYRPFKFAYQYAYIKYSVEGIEYRCIPDDYMGEEKLTSGKYTYEVSMDTNKIIHFRFIRD